MCGSSYYLLPSCFVPENLSDDLLLEVCKFLCKFSANFDLRGKISPQYQFDMAVFTNQFVPIDCAGLQLEFD